MKLFRCEDTDMLSAIGVFFLCMCIIGILVLILRIAFPGYINTHMGEFPVISGTYQSFNFDYLWLRMC